MTRFGILGPLQITQDGRPLHRGGPKLRTLVAALLVHANETVSVDRLAEALWPGNPPSNAANALQSQVSRLRSLIESADSGDSGEPGRAPGGAGRLEHHRTGYLLRVERDELDALAFEAHSQDCDAALAAGNRRAAVEHADLALACWRGRALEEFVDHDFARSRAAQLEERRVVTIEHRIEAKLALGEHRALIGELRELVDLHPLREPLWIHLILALYRSDRQSEALDAFREIQGILAEELGLLPCPELARLESQMLQQAPELELASLPASGPVDVVGSPGPAGTTNPTAAGARLVTFLFTDVDHTGARWDRDVAGTSARFQRTEQAVRGAIETCGGTVFGQPSEGFCAAFDRPRDAVAAAVEGQRRLRAEVGAGRGEHGEGAVEQRNDGGVGGTPDADRLGVRMAVHTGEADFGDGYYSGAAANRVARMRDAGHGGQILVSAATHALLHDQPPEDGELVDIGRWSFDGFSRAEAVYELRHPDLATGFPPLRSGRQLTGKLPRHSTSFLGRARETGQVLTALEGCGLLSLTGEGGIGKTRLALEIARRAKPSHYPDGVWFCDLSSIDDPAGLADHLMATLQPESRSAGNGGRELLEVLRGGQLLLILDNCERLREPLAQLVDGILASDSPATILATSRAPLQVRGERVVKLDPLALPEDEAASPLSSPAVQLLIDRARAAGASVPAEDPALAAIARSLDGLPLAIELAAPRLATLSARDLAARLDRSTELLTGAQGLPTRQRTLRATVDSSFRLLSEPTRLLFGTLSVFRGGWTLPAAEVVATAADLSRDTAAPLISDLVEQSMIRVSVAPEGTARYGMLDTIRIYAGEYLDETGYDRAVADAHAAYFVELAETAAGYRRGHLEAAWVEALDGEFPNLRAAYRWLVGSDQVAEALRLVTALADDILMREWLEVGRWAEELAGRPELKTDPLHPVAVALAGNTAMVEGRLAEALRLSETALAGAEQTDGPPVWVAHNTLALLAAGGTSGHHLHRHLEAMDRISDATGDPLPAAVADYDRVLITSLAGDPGAGLPAAEALFRRVAPLNNPSLAAMAHLCHGRAVALDNPEDAAHRFRRALDAASSAQNTLLVQQSLRAIDELDARQTDGDPTAVLTSLRTIIRQFEETGNVGEQLHTLTSMLEPLAALRAFEPVATICGALAPTPWRHTATWRLAERRAAESLGDEPHQAARQAGVAMSPADVVAFASRTVQALLAEHDSAGTASEAETIGVAEMIGETGPFESEEGSPPPGGGPTA